MLNVLVAVVLAQVSLVADPSSLGLHPGASATVRITGATGTLGVTSGPLVTESVDPATQSIVVTAAGELGHDVVHVTDQTGATLDIPVLVAQDAGTVPPAITLKITGTALDPQWFADAVGSAVRRNAVVQSGAQLSEQAATVTPPAPGATATVPVTVTIAGNGSYLDVAATTNVTVANVAAEPFAPPTLMYDDDPEHLTSDGVVYRGTVAPGTPSRLYYYHDNTSDPRRLAVVLSASAAPSSVEVIDSTAGPNIDVMSVGHAVSRNFLLMKPRNEGVVYDVASGQPVVLHDLTMTSRQLVAGTLGINVLAGGPVTVTVLAIAPTDDPRAALQGPVLPGDGHHRTGVFNLNNFGTDSLAFAVGGADASVVYGDRQPTPANVDPASAGHDYGDYGVIHTLLFSLSNPTASPANVYLYERPIGGVVRSSFLVDGSLVDMGCVKLNTTRYQVAAFSLAPNARYQLNVQSMADGGSNYPIEVGLTTTAPQPTTPPISAPEGCFPKSP